MGGGGGPDVDGGHDEAREVDRVPPPDLVRKGPAVVGLGLRQRVAHAQ